LRSESGTGWSAAQPNSFKPNSQTHIAIATYIYIQNRKENSINKNANPSANLENLDPTFPAKKAREERRKRSEGRCYPAQKTAC
jgi:hypothetical protein